MYWLFIYASYCNFSNSTVLNIFINIETEIPDVYAGWKAYQSYEYFPDDCTHFAKVPQRGPFGSVNVFDCD